MKMEEFKTVPKAKRKIENLLNTLKFKPKKKVDFFIKNKKHLYSSKCINKNGKLVFIKVILEDKKRFFASLKKEIQILKYITEHKSLSEKIKITKYLDGDFKGSFPWFIHEFVPGKILGEFYDLFQTSTKYIKPLVTNLVGLHNIPLAYIRKIKKEIKIIDTVKVQNFKNIIQEHQKNSPKLRKLVDFKAINQLFEKQYKYLEKAPIVLTHGDFTFSNQIIHKNQIYLTDWEWVRFDNFCVDLAHLWVQSWRYPKWQNLLLKNYQKFLNKKLKTIFEQAFKIVLSIQILNELRWNTEICPKKQKKKAEEFCLKTIKKLIKNN